MIPLRIPLMLRIVCGLLLALLSSAAPLRAQVLSESQIKAGFLYNFAKYIEWPAEAFPGKDAPLTLCVIGRDTLGPPLDSFDGKVVHGHPVAVKRMAGGSEDFRGCHILFVSESEQRHLAPILRTAQGPLLTVSDVDGFIDVGGGIGLVTADERIQFEVNLGALQRAGLKASSQLLKLARNVGSMRGRN